MEKRVLLAVFLSFLVLFVYQMLVPSPPRTPGSPEESGPQPASGPAGPREPMEALPEAARTPPEAVQPVEQAPAAEAVVSDTLARDIVVDAPWVRAIWSSRGGTLKSWKLKHFQDGLGRPLELVPQDLPGDDPRPFSLRVNDPDITPRLNDALYRPSVEGLVLSDRSETLTFEYRDTAGLAVEKTFQFDPAEPYVIRFSASVEVGGRALNPTVDWGPAMAEVTANGGWAGYSQPPGGIFFREGDVSRLGVSDLREQPTYEGRFGFVGVDDHYFIAVALPQDRQVKVEYRPVALPAAAPDQQTAPLVAFSALFPDPPSDIRFFFGPKDFDVLRGIDGELVRAIHFGWFSWLVVPLLRALKWVNGYVGNYGWAIVILTILINAAMFPLRHKSVVSMRKMQELQPEVKAIQERYSKLKTTDPARQKMNVELMNLYRDRGVNPASGCVPMLLTMPVLFAFYSLLSVAIEIRGAPFILWIKDLSAHDPLYVTPVLMGATMVLQQKMTPSTADPMQQKMMMMMPIVFTFMFLWAPSGLVLYWFVSNLWAIGQQHVTNKIIGPPAVRSVRPPAERRIKKVGAGKSERAEQERARAGGLPGGRG